MGVAPSPETLELLSPEDVAAANKLELARGAGQRYLVQRWESGTQCDKTGLPRKVEVQVRSLHTVFLSRKDSGGRADIYNWTLR